MPRSAETTFTCPCGETFPVTMYQTVNVTLEPELLYRLLAGSLNVAVCPNCGRKAMSAQPFIYHDMARGLFAYVHPRGDVSDEEREVLLGRLRQVYDFAVAESDRLTQPRNQPRMPVEPRVKRRTPEDDLARIEPEVPPMQVIFGMDRLTTLVDSLLEPGERLARVALNTHSSAAEERTRLHDIAEHMAGEIGCLVEVEDAPDEYTAWIYGPRDKVNLIGKALRGEA
jgi:CpXC protein